jgi:nucleoside-diphosphate-sugar epimerase
MRILVTGGTGFLGRRCVAVLSGDGYAVRAVGRDEAVCRQLAAAGVEVVRADLRDRSAIVAACAGVDAVVHAGALSAPWGRQGDFRAINVGGTAHVLDGCKQHRVERMIYISSPSVTFDGRDHLNQDESAPYPRTWMSVYSHTKKLGEDLTNEARDRGLQTVILRPKAIFGPGDRALLPRLLLASRQGRLPQVGDGRNLVDLTYVDNVVHAVCLALTADRAIGRTYLITNDEHVPLWELIRDVLRRLGASAALRARPYRLVYAVAAMLELKARLFGGEPLLTRYTTAVLGRTQTYDISAARRDLGYAPLVSVAEGVELTLAALQESPPHG